MNNDLKLHAQIVLTCAVVSFSINLFLQLTPVFLKYIPTIIIGQCILMFWYLICIRFYFIYYTLGEGKYAGF